MVAIAFCAATPTRAANIPGAQVIFSWKAITPGGTHASYTYDAATNSYYLATFGSFAGLHKITPTTSTSNPWASVQYASQTSSFPSDMLRYIRSSDVPGGAVNTAFTGSSTIGSILLNPKPITLTVPQTDSAGVPIVGLTQQITYQPGQLAIITDGTSTVNDGTSPRPDYTKKVYTWDLRAIGTPTTALPDYSTGKSGAPAPNENPGGAYGALGQADWNDVFTTVATEANVRAAYLAKTGTAAASSAMPFTRQSAWSTDGQSIYHGVTGSGAGLYKFNIPNGTTQMIYSQSEVITDVAVLASSIRNFGGGTGDQVLIDGNTANGNAGGLSYVVDNGTSVSATQVAFSGVDYRAYNERTAAGSLRGIAADSVGNIYFYDNGTGSLHKYDNQGRFSSVVNRAQLLEINHTVDGARADGGGMLRLQVREDLSGTYVTWRGDNDYVGAVRIFDPGDLNKDNVVNNADKNFFETQYNKSMHGGVPNPLTGTGTTADFVDYIAADLNGSGLPNGTAALPSLSNEAVTYMDLQVLSQFIDLELGDFNWNGSALDANDWSIFNSHFNIDPGVFGWDDYGWFDGDVSGALEGVPDGLVNQLDLDYLLANQAAAVPEPGSLVAMGVALAVFGFFANRQRGQRKLLPSPRCGERGRR